MDEKEELSYPPPPGITRGDTGVFQVIWVGQCSLMAYCISNNLWNSLYHFTFDPHTVRTTLTYTYAGICLSFSMT